MAWELSLKVRGLDPRTYKAPPRSEWPIRILRWDATRQRYVLLRRVNPNSRRRS